LSGHPFISPPGFPLYATLARGLGIDTKEYNLLPERDWEVDLDHLASLVDNKTRALVLNNPSNPCGSVYDEEHLRKILKICEDFCLPLIADEIYEHMVFRGSNKRYVPVASLTKTVPILSCGGITKRYLIPGMVTRFWDLNFAQSAFPSVLTPNFIRRLEARLDHDSRRQRRDGKRRHLRRSSEPQPKNHRSQHRRSGGPSVNTQ
jgi:hypothetical protein